MRLPGLPWKCSRCARWYWWRRCCPDCADAIALEALGRAMVIMRAAWNVIGEQEPQQPKGPVEPSKPEWN